MGTESRQYRSTSENKILNLALDASKQGLNYSVDYDRHSKQYIINIFKVPKEFHYDV